MKFSSRVDLYGAYGFVRHLPDSEAHRMVAAGQAMPMSDRGKVRALKITGGLSMVRERPASALTLRNYTGWKPTYREPVRNAAGDVDGHVLQLKRIDDADAPLFRLSITDCLTEATHARSLHR